MRDRDAQLARWRFLALAYVALLIYASLFPFSGWTAPSNPFGFLAPAWPHHWRRVDILINVLAYVPLGLLLARWWSRRTQPSLNHCFFALSQEAAGQWCRTGAARHQ